MGIGRRDRGVTIFDRGFDAKWIVGSGFARVANGLICGQLESFEEEERPWEGCSTELEDLQCLEMSRWLEEARCLESHLAEIQPVCPPCHPWIVEHCAVDDNDLRAQTPQIQ